MTSLLSGKEYEEAKALAALKNHVLGVKKCGLASDELILCREDVIDCRFKNGPFRRIGLKIYVRATTYPTSGVIPELSSVSVAPGVLKKLQSKCEEMAKTGGNAAGGTQNVLLQIINFIKGIVEENKLLCCIHEIRKAKKELGKKCSEFNINEKTGHCRMKLTHGKYSSVLDFLVPDRYPEEGCEVKLIKSTFPKKVVQVYLMQTREIVRKCCNGYSVEEALMASRPEKVPPLPSKKQEIKITNELANQLKRDVKFLKKVDQLKTVNADKGKRNQFFQHDNATRKAARRELRKLAKSEMAKELNWKAEAEAQQAAIDAKLVRAMADGNGPTHHVGAIIDFVANHFVTRLPLEPCQGCQKMLLPDDPSKAAQVFSKDNKNRARRVYCSHWWHHKCLNKCLTKPPFGTQGCPECGLRVWHHEWERDIKRLEKRWAAKEARKREMSEVADSFGGLGKEFLREKKKKAESDDDSESEDIDSDEDPDAKASAILFQRY